MSERKTDNRFDSFTDTNFKRFCLFFLILALGFFLLEIFSLGLLTSYFYFQGRSVEQLKAHFLFTQPFFENPVIRFSSANYVGFYPTQSSARQWTVADPMLGWRNGKNVGITSIHGDGDGLEWRITNPQGFIPAGKLDFNVSPQKQPDAFRIIIFGGSTVAGYGAKNPLENLPSQFSQALKKRFLPKNGFTQLEIINAGVDGYFSLNQYLYFSTELTHYDPDLVIFYDGWNDYRVGGLKPIYAKRWSKHYEWQKRLNDSYTISGSSIHLAKSIGAFFTNQTYQFASLWIIKRLMQKIFIDKTLTLGTANNIGDFKLTIKYLNGVPLFSKKTVELYTTNIGDTIAFAREKNIKIAYFLQPILGVTEKQPIGFEKKWLQLNTTEANNRKLFYAVVRNRLKNIEVKYQIPSEVCIRDLSKATKDEKSRVFSDSGHLNKMGNFILAHSMVDSLLECSIIPVVTTQSIKPGI